jgi:dTDP-4-amino-4,6-dideoxygalactose transaminase
MRYPYSNPNLRIKILLKALLFSDFSAIEKIQDYFRILTGKKYVIITNSCRSALFLAYKSLDKKGEVITSPLTCEVAIDPIKTAGNKVVFADIRLEDLNINPYDIEHRITKDTIAIQAIHIGGNSCEIDLIRKIATEHQLLVVEDCAQSFGATYKGINTGSFGDVSCFSLIKNAYGIGGGILATNSEKVYQEAVKLNDNLPKQKKILAYYRIIRNVLTTYGAFPLSNALLKLSHLKSNKEAKSVTIQLKKALNIEIKIAAAQIDQYDSLHSKRCQNGILLNDILRNEDILFNQGISSKESSFTKVFVYNSSFDSRLALINLNKRKIEAMHLTQKHGSPFQEKIVSNEVELSTLPVFNSVHDKIISLPLTEDFNLKELNYITQEVKRLKNERK